MASMMDMRREEAAPTAPVPDLTERELRLAMELAVSVKVNCERASEMALTGVGEPAIFTLAEKLVTAWRDADFPPPVSDEEDLHRRVCEILDVDPLRAHCPRCNADLDDVCPIGHAGGDPDKECPVRKAAAKARRQQRADPVRKAPEH